ncbi:MAG TPA: hypothetical protein VK468_00370 [Pyrinomonadaceae bacterium]|nr:hypothetical protein [Pyrinomonadaceae bacterium]
MNYVTPSEGADYKLSIEQRQRYLYAMVDGADDNVKTVLAYWKKIAAELKNSAERRLLFEKMRSAELSVTAAFTVTSAVASMGLVGTKIAFVKHDPDVNRTSAFTETASLNRGLIVKIFAAADIAEEWLLRD